jgi:hypothetical protein
MKTRRGFRGQSVLETTLLFSIITFALIAMQVYVKRAVQGRVRSGMDSIGTQYDPERSSSNATTTHSSSTTTTTNTTPTMMSLIVCNSSGCWYGVPRVVDISTTEIRTDYDDTTQTGTEVVPAP